MSLLDSFEKSIKVDFKDKDLLKQAFTHRSYINENPNLKFSHNERLEFLGDAVLELVVTDFLFRKYPNHNEGEMTAFRSSLVNAVIIAEVAKEIGVNECLLLSKGESKDIGKARQYILANTYEAIVGAIYLDQGIGKAHDFIEQTLLNKIDEIVKNKSWKDSKSLIQEKAQEFLSVTPAYRVLEETGPDHDKHFIMGIFFADDLIAKGKGKSKQEAEQKAAVEALKVKKWDN